MPSTAVICCCSRVSGTGVAGMVDGSDEGPATTLVGLVMVGDCDYCWDWAGCDVCAGCDWEE